MVCIALTHGSTHASSLLGDISQIPAGVWTAIDARPKAACSTLSVRDARCLPTRSLVASKGPGKDQLVSFYHMLWLLGSLGVSEHERVVVFAEHQSDAYALGALLFLVGHSRVSVWTESVERLLKATNTGPGRTRGLLRTRYWAAPVREESIALASELDALVESNWRLTTDLNAIKESRVVVAGENPVLVLERFGRLAAASAEVSANQLRLVVDPVNTTAPVIRPALPQLLGALLLLVAILCIGAATWIRSKAR